MTAPRHLSWRKNMADGEISLTEQLRRQLREGRRQRALALARDIWTEGPPLSREEKCGYIHNLMALKMFEMAHMLLEEMIPETDDEQAVFLEYAFAVDDNKILERAAASADEKKYRRLLKFIAACHENQYWLPLSQIRKIIFSTVSENLCGYNVSLKNSRGTINLTGSFELNLPAEECENLRQKIAEEIIAQNIAVPENFTFGIKSLKAPLRQPRRSARSA